MKRAFEREHEKYYVRFSTIRAVLRDVVLASETFPKSLEYIYPFIAGKELDSTTFFSRGKQEKDVLIFLRQRLLYKDYEKWRRPVLTAITDIVERAVRRYERVGIVSRRYSIAVELARLLREIGFEVVVDAERNFRERIRTAQVIILTTKGRLYRGINILVGEEDVRVVVALWQGSLEKKHHPRIEDLLQEIGDFERDIWPHFVDERFYTAFYHWFKDYLYEKVVKVEVEEIEKLADVVKQYL